MAVALQDQQRLNHQREALFSANAAVYRAGTLQASLQAIAELAPKALAVDICMVVLDEANGDRAFRRRGDRAARPRVGWQELCS